MNICQLYTIRYSMRRNLLSGCCFVLMVIPGADSAQILSQPENYIDSSEYASWEQYFTQYLADMTKDHPLWCYSKKKLPAIYLSARVLRAAKKFMQLIIWD